MALPTKIDTWKFLVNASIAAGGSDTAGGRNLLFAIKQAILGAGSWTDSNGTATSAPTGWSVVGSSNSSASGMDAVDRWTVATDLVWAAAGVHSWIVLRHATLGDILFDCVHNTTAGTQMTIAWSKAGYGIAAGGGSNGSTSSAPTAANSVVFMTAAAWGSCISGGTSNRLHVMMSATGLHIVACRVGHPALFASFTGVTEPRLTGGQWAAQVVVRWTGVSTASPGAGTVGGTFSTTFSGRGASVNLTFSPMTWGTAGGDTPMSAAGANGITGEIPIIPLGLYCTTGSNEGLYGFLPDVWLTPDAARNFGFPDDSAAEWQAFSNHIMPWNKTTALLS